MCGTKNTLKRQELEIRNIYKKYILKQNRQRVLRR